MTLYMTFSTVANADAEPMVEEAALPADDETLAQLAENAGLDSIDDPIRTYDLRIDGLTDLDSLVELASLHEANILATRLAQLQDYELAEVEAFAKMRFGDHYELGGDELINLTYQLQSCIRLPNIFNYTDLGKFVIENDMDADLSDLPDSTFELLDPESVGRKWHGYGNGIFTKFGYTEQLEQPEALPHPYVRTVTSLMPTDDDKTISVVLTEKQWQIVGDALRTWDAPTTVQDAVSVIRDKLQASIQEQTVNVSPYQPTLGL